MSRWPMWLRITVPAAVVTLAFLMGLSMAAGRGLEPLRLRSVDAELGKTLEPAAAAVQAGRAPSPVAGVTLRVLDTDGTPVDGGSPVPALGPAQIRAL
ncbi:MAG TPA: two-component sensor histidine kinase, partial [Amycolatopsis sp.]|nr:two-component sensor histidine kinase [Amycolatopsis sp.]